MNIGLDLSPIVHRKAGLATYAQNLAENLLRLDHTNSYNAFYFGGSERAPLSPPLDKLPRFNIPWSARRWRLTVALNYFLNRNMTRAFEAFDLFHATEHLLPPMKNVHSVFTFHDAIYALFPQYHLPMNYWFLKTMMPRFLKRADAIIAVSESSKRDAVRLYNVAPEKIRVVYEGVNPLFRPLDDAADLARAHTKYHLPARFVLYFGTVEPRKNLTTLLDAFHALLQSNDSAPELVFAGRKGWLFKPVFDRVRELGLDARVHFTDWIDEADAPALLNLADVFVYPSLYEGFGLPPLEALACGVPVICSNASSLPEVVGDGGILLAPREVQAWVEALQNVLGNQSLRNELKTRGLAQAKKFSWARAARETLDVYHSVVHQAR